MNALSRTSQALSTSMTRLSTGYRVNSAMDDAAGLQIATRLTAQASGTKVALRNIQNGISLLQTAEGVAQGIEDLFMRMKDLATQAADGSYTDRDVEAMQTEFETLYKQHWTLLDTQYAGESLFVYTVTQKAKLFEPLSFQIGASSGEMLSVNFNSAFSGALGVTGWGDAGLVDLLKDRPDEAIEVLTTSLDGWGAVRSAFGAVSNRLEHASNNQANMLQNTKASAGRILDTDYASESAKSTSQQMLLQASSTMLKQSSSTAKLIASLVQN
jgi:flagellin